MAPPWRSSTTPTTPRTGIVMIAVSAWRFRRTAKEIDAAEMHPGTGNRADYALAILLIVLGAGFLFYLYHAVTKSA